MSHDCLFCKIIRGDAPATFLYEDDDLVVFRDINPAAPVHLLLVPRKHIRSMNDIQHEDAPIISKLFFVAKQMAKAQEINASGYKLLFNVEKGGGQEIFHIHLHLIGGWRR